MVKYELWEWQYVHGETGQPWGAENRKMATDIEAIIGQQFRGTVLFQMIDDLHLKMEAFPGLEAESVSGFTENAVIYEK